MLSKINMTFSDDRGIAHPTDLGYPVQSSLFLPSRLANCYFCIRDTFARANAIFLSWRLERNPI